MKQRHRVPLLFQPIQSVIEIGLAPLLCCIAIAARFKHKDIDVGIGPHPIINSGYHKLALERYGYTAETFVAKVWHVTDQFDVRADKVFSSRYRFIDKPLRYFGYLYLGILALWRYRCLYIYFTGGAFSMGGGLLRRLEPFLYKLANIKVVMMSYGADVQEMTRSSNLLFKHTNARDYPEHSLRRTAIAAAIDRWTKYADHIIAGCEWVDYLYHWDTLLPHYHIDVDLWEPLVAVPAELLDTTRPLRILHAPNHRAVKGTRYFVEAVSDLMAEGLPVELVLLEGVPNDQVRNVMASVDVVADQLIIGWYGMFALEAMALEKPVLCYLREDLQYLYITAGLVEPDEIPIINCSPLTVKETIRDLVLHREQLPEIGRQSRVYARKHHSVQVIGKVFDAINHSIGLKPSRK